VAFEAINFGSIPAPPANLSKVRAHESRRTQPKVLPEKANPLRAVFKAQATYKKVVLCFRIYKSHFLLQFFKGKIFNFLLYSVYENKFSSIYAGDKRE
jgi:hypothetical protein